MQTSGQFEQCDADGRVCVDAPCLICGYNLRSLLSTGLCPECGQPVMPSLRGDLLRFASPHWVRRLARGTLLILIAVGVTVGIYLLSPIMMGILVAAGTAGFGGPVMPRFMPFTAVIQSAAGLGAMVLMMIGLFLLSSRDPAAPLRPEGFCARRLVRYGLWLMPAPIVLGLMASLSVISQPPVTATAPAFPQLPVVFWVFMVGAALASFLAYFLVPLASLRLTSRLMRRVPRPGLALFAQIEFWGLLSAGSILAVTYAWMFFAFLIPMFRALPALATMPTTGPAWTTTAPGAVPPVVTYSYNVGSTSVTTTSAPAGVTTMPAPVMPPGMPMPGPALLIFGGLSGMAGCAMFGFAVAGIVLLIMVQRALARAAREAGQAVTASPPPTDL